MIWFSVAVRLYFTEVVSTLSTRFHIVIFSSLSRFHWPILLESVSLAYIKEAAPSFVSCLKYLYWSPFTLSLYAICLYVLPWSSNLRDIHLIYSLRLWTQTFSKPYTSLHTITCVRWCRRLQEVSSWIQSCVTEVLV